MTRLRMAGWITFLAVFVLAGCGGNSSTQSTTPAPDTTQITEPLADDGASSSDSSADDSARTAQLTQEIDEFGGAGTGYETSWYQLIDSIEVHGTSLDIRTSIYPDSEGRAIAKDLCNILNANYVGANTATYGLETVTVYAQDDPVSFTSPMDGHC